MKTLHDITQVASTRLRHEWELGMATINPTATIRRIAGEIAPRQPQTRQDIEICLHEQLAQLCCAEGDDDDYAR